ncbi:hypothetical protein HII31_11404 [Pseudocercospora fuligena]|uniref:Uncharacterized protein n=1 Tax=Pseudocercospora fuligena TaxID=685502 RepID=A0A8H6RA26_9PEZI|nr:hypothetical protein HII31_11404 [Pseudocercospora fuligena]
MENDSPQSGAHAHIDQGQIDAAPTTSIDESESQNGHVARSWTAPITIISGLFIGLAIALAHHFMNSSLSGKTVESVSLSQAWVSRFATALAFLTKTAFVMSVGAAFMQHQWHRFHRQSYRIEEVDALTSVLGNILNLFSHKFWIRNPLLALMAIVAWTIPLAAIVTPASLSVAPQLYINTTIQYVPEPLFGGYKGYETSTPFGQLATAGGETSPGAPTVSGSDPVYKHAFGAASSGQPASIPSSSENQTYHLDFLGPAVHCSSANDSIIYNATMELGSQTSWAWFGGTTFASWTGQGLVAPTYSQHDRPETLDYINTDVARIWVMTNTGKWNVTLWRKPDNTTNSDEYSEVLWTQVNVTECQLYNASYIVDFEFQYPNQATNTSISQWLNRITTVGMYPRQESKTPHLAMMDAFGKLLVGSHIFSHYGDIPSYYTSWNIIDIDWSRGEQVQRGLEQLFQNCTLSVLSEKSLLKNATTGAQPVAVTSSTHPISYVYNQQDLWLAYGLCLVSTLLCAGIGTRAFVANDHASFQNMFSTYLRATGDAELRAIVPIDDTGADPLAKNIAKARIMMQGSGKE